jgi:hypothetical protein
MGRLLVSEYGAGEIWSGQPDGRAVLTALFVPESDDAIVLLDADTPGAPKSDRNLVRCRVDGSVVWRAELPDPSGPDAYTEVTWAKAGLLGNSWSCYLVRLDPMTGRILEKTFTK